MIEYLNSEGLQLHNPEDITNKFGDYFSTVGKKFAERIASPNKGIDEYLRARSGVTRTLYSYNRQHHMNYKN